MGCEWTWRSLMLPRVLLTLSIFFFPAYLHSSIPSLHPFHRSLAQSLYKKAILLVLPGPLGEMSFSSLVQGLFGYQTCSSNLHGVNTNIPVSCRLPGSLKRARGKSSRTVGIVVGYLIHCHMECLNGTDEVLAS